MLYIQIPYYLVLYANSDLRCLTVQALPECNLKTAPGALCKEPSIVGLSISRWSDSRDCTGKCVVQESENARRRRLWVDTPACKTQELSIDRNTMESCTKNPYADDYYTLACAGEEVFYSAYSDSRCTRPLYYRASPPPASETIWGGRPFR